jgi:hypothetical protein
VYWVNAWNTSGIWFSPYLFLGDVHGYTHWDGQHWSVARNVMGWWLLLLLVVVVMGPDGRGDDEIEEVMLWSLL